MKGWRDGIMEKEDRYNADGSLFQPPETQYSSIPIFHYSSCSSQLSHVLNFKDRWG